MLTLQIIFCILAAICAAAVLPLGTFFGWTWAIIAVSATLLFFGLTLLCKQIYLAKHPQDIKDEANTQDKPREE